MPGRPCWGAWPFPKRLSRSYAFSLCVAGSLAQPVERTLNFLFRRIVVKDRFDTPDHNRLGCANISFARWLIVRNSTPFELQLNKQSVDHENK